MLRAYEAATCVAFVDGSAELFPVDAALLLRRIHGHEAPNQDLRPVQSCMRGSQDGGPNSGLARSINAVVSVTAVQ